MNVTYLKHVKILPMTLAFLFLINLSGCQSVYYDAMEKVGVHKRDIMVDRVESAKESQEEAKETFKSALDRYQSLFGKLDTPLQEKYEEMQQAFDNSEAAANEVSERIDAVEEVSFALFDEWEEELTQYTSQSLKQTSAKKLNETRRKYSQLIVAMKKAEKRMVPVLNAFRDQVLFLKHNLNAQAINGLKQELKNVKSNVSRLVKEMEAAIKESERFIRQLEQ